MALFGAPTAHEDDPERAVRAALAIRDFAVEDGLELRVGITTGEALVSLDARPDAGEGMASGDVVNTAARLQSAAPVNGDPRRRDDLPCDAPRDRLRECAAGRSQGQGRADPGLDRRSPPTRASVSTSRTKRARSSSAASASSASCGTPSSGRATSERRSSSRSSASRESARAASSTSSNGSSRPIRSSSRGVRAAASRTATGSRCGRSARSSRRRPASSSRTHRRTIAAKIHQAVEDTLAGTGDEAAWSSRISSRSSASPRESAARRRPAQRGIRRVAALPRGPRRAASARPRRRGHPLGRREPPRLPRRARRLGDGRPAPRRRDGTAGAPRAPTRLGRREAQRDDARALAALRRADRASSSQACSLAPCSPPSRSSLSSSEQAATRSTRSSSSSSTSSRDRPTSSALPRRSRASSPRASTVCPGRRRACCRTLPSSARSSGRARSDAARRRCGTLHSLERKGFVRRQRRSSLEGRERVRVRTRARPRRRVRADRHAPTARRSIAMSPSGSTASDAPRITRRCSRTTGARRSSSSARSGGDDDELVERTRLALRDAGDRAFALNSLRGRRRRSTTTHSRSGRTTTSDPSCPVPACRSLSLVLRRGASAGCTRSRARRIAGRRRHRARLGGGVVPRTSLPGSRSARSRPRASRACGSARRRLDARPQRREFSPSRARPSCSWRSRASRTKGDVSPRRPCDGDRARTRRATRTCAHDDRHDEERRRTTRRVSPTWSARSRSRSPPTRRSQGRSSTTSASTRRSRATFDARTSCTPRRIRLAERYGDALERPLRPRQSIWLDFMLGRWDHALESADAFIAECEAGSPHTLEGLGARSASGSSRLARGDRDRCASRPAPRARARATSRPNASRQLGSSALSAAVATPSSGSSTRRTRSRPRCSPLVREVGLHGAVIRLALHRRRTRHPVTSSAMPLAQSRRAAQPSGRTAIAHILAGELEAAADIDRVGGEPDDRGDLRSTRASDCWPPDERADARSSSSARSTSTARSTRRPTSAEIESALAGAQSESA